MLEGRSAISSGVVISDKSISGPWQLIRVSDLEEGFNLLLSLDPKAPALLVFDGVWGRAFEVARYASSRGLNVFNVDFLDAEAEVDLVCGVIGLETLVQARLARLRTSSASSAPIRVSLGKVVSRRDLLKLGPVAALEYLNRPIVDRESCQVLPSCRLCIEACPEKALSGKPPSVNYDICTLCGVCFSICPVEAIYSPQTTPGAIEAYTEALRETTGEPLVLLIARYEDLGDLRILKCMGYPTVLLPLWSLSEISPLSLLRMAHRGLTPVIYAKHGIPRPILELEQLGVVRVAKSFEELQARIAVGPVYSPRPHSDTPRGFALEVLSSLSLSGNLQLSFPGVGIVSVDPNLCTLCGVCTKTCPTGALSLVEGDYAKLLFEPSSCIGCKECEVICPERAIKVTWAYKKSIERTLAESPIAKCIGCGTPIGPEALIKGVERKLEKAGIKPRHTRLCQSCKTKWLIP